MAADLNEETAMPTRRSLLATAGGLALACPAVAQAWPERPLRLIVPYPPGGAVDLAGRLIAEGLRAQLGQPVLVENRPGAGGNIGIATLAKAAPDGLTLGATAVNSLAINQFIYGQLPFDPERDLVPVSLGWEAPLVLVVPAAAVPARTLTEFTAWAKGRAVSYGSSGIGTTVHLSGALFALRQDLDATHVPFRGGSEALTALLRGDTQFAVDNLPTVLAAVQEGTLRALAVTSASRWADLPAVPTMAEAGMADFVVTSWGAVSVPAGTPRPIVERLSAAMRAAAADPAMRARFAATGNQPLGTTPEAAADRAARERPMWRDAVRVSGARLSGPYGSPDRSGYRRFAASWHMELFGAAGAAGGQIIALGGKHRTNGTGRAGPQGRQHRG